MKELYKDTYAKIDKGVRVFLLICKTQALVVDTGMGGLYIHKMVCEHTTLPYRLINTHADRDHIGSNFQFSELYMHPSESFFYYNIQNGEGNIIPIYEGDTINLGERIVEIIHLLGHTPGSITILDKKSRSINRGDPIQEDSSIYMFCQHRDMKVYINSLKRILKRNDFDYIYPSHGKEKIGIDTIPKLIEGAEKILLHKVEREEIEVFGNKIFSYDIQIAKILLDK